MHWSMETCWSFQIQIMHLIYRVIRNNCLGFNNLSYTSFSRCNPMWFLSMGLRQGSGLCSSSSRKYRGTEGTNQNRHWNHHRWHATNSLEWTRLSCWRLKSQKGCTYRAPIRYVTKTWSVVLLNKKYTYSSLKCIVYDKLLKPWQSFRITLYCALVGYML